MDIIYQDLNWIVVNKPALWLSVPSRLGDKDERPCLGKHLEAHLQKTNANAKVFPTHRLDFEVSGVMLFALNKDAHKLANSWFEKHLVEKTYQAITSPTTKLSATEIDNFKEKQIWLSQLVRGKKRTFAAPHGLPAETHARLMTINSLGQYCWELAPRTGRSHQLRFELSQRGFPILGDILYNGLAEWPGEGIALRAIALKIPPAYDQPELIFKTTSWF